MRTIACIATINGRQDLLKNTLKMLAPQVTEVFVVFRYEPNFKLPSNCTYIIRDNEKGDADKFYLYCKNPGLADVWFFCDDDIFYPADYVTKALKHIKDHKGVLSFHGRTIKLRPVESYYRRSRIEAFGCTSRVKKARRVDPNGTLGTGVMFFRSGAVKLNIEDFEYPNMADVWMAKFAIEQGVPMTVCPHEHQWIRGQDPNGEITPGIFRTYQFNDERQAEVYNGIRITA